MAAATLFKSARPANPKLQAKSGSGSASSGDYGAQNGKEDSLWTNALILFFLTCTAALAFFVRITSVLRFENIIHEADPWFNFRAARYLSENGYLAYKNWFDIKTWYPSGRPIQSSAYHGMMYTSMVMKKFVEKFVPEIDIKTLCVFNGPIFSIFTVYITYLINAEIFNKLSGVLAAFFVGLIPSLVARTHSGSYDYESMSIFLIQAIIFFWVKALKNDSMIYGGFSGLFYFYLNSTWGGFVYMSNLISMHAISITVSGNYSKKLLRSFAGFVSVLLLCSFHVPFNRHAHIKSAENLSPLVTLVMLICIEAFAQISQFLKELEKEGVQAPSQATLASVAAFAILCLLSVLIFTGKIYKFSGRVYKLIDPNYFVDASPIVTSVAEHGATDWKSMFSSSGILLLICPLGIYLGFAKYDNENWIVLINYIVLIYCTQMMNRLKLLLSPAMSLVAGFTFAESLNLLFKQVSSHLSNYSILATLMPEEFHDQLRSKRSQKNASVSSESYTSIVNFFLCCVMLHFIVHAFLQDIRSFDFNGLTTPIYHNGRNQLSDDVKDAYQWLRMNTPSGTRVISWWDYGYQLTGLANATVFVDNFTADYYRIAIVGLIMSGNEDLAIKYMEAYGVDYLLVFAPGITKHWHGDDISKMYWMIRISQNEFPDKIDESDYYKKQHGFTTNEHTAPGLAESVMYKSCFYEQERHRLRDGRVGINPNNNQPVYSALHGGVHFKYLEEAYSSSVRTMRIYRFKQRSDFFVSRSRAFV